jgi:hypothetical protein
LVKNTDIRRYKIIQIPKLINPGRDKTQPRINDVHRASRTHRIPLRISRYFAVLSIPLLSKNPGASQVIPIPIKPSPLYSEKSGFDPRKLLKFLLTVSCRHYRT